MRCCVIFYSKTDHNHDTGENMNEGNIYFHDHGDGILHSHHTEEHSHEGGPEHTHGHTHSHTQTKAVLNRLARAIGHLEHVKRMVEDGQDCTDVLLQLAAGRSALSSTAKIILKDHIEHCIAGVESGDRALEELTDAIDKFI